ncbi:MAG: hypothetical protein U0165_19600 [Polyangiaceae bacterium]
MAPPSKPTPPAFPQNAPAPTPEANSAGSQTSGKKPPPLQRPAATMEVDPTWLDDELLHPSSATAPATPLATPAAKAQPGAPNATMSVDPSWLDELDAEESNQVSTAKPPKLPSSKG